MRLAVSVLIVCLAYVANAEANQAFGYYYTNAADPRFFRPTTTSTVTSTFTTTCTRVVAGLANCGGRRRRGILFEEDNEEQFPIAPTAVQGVEPTQEPSREARAADPQYFIASPFGYQAQNIDSAVYSGPYNYRPIALPYYGSYAQPEIEQRLFFNAWRVTVTSTLFSTTTSTSIPTCVVAGTLPQC